MCIFLLKIVFVFNYLLFYCIIIFFIGLFFRPVIGIVCCADLDLLPVFCSFSLYFYIFHSLFLFGVILSYNGCLSSLS